MTARRNRSPGSVCAPTGSQPIHSGSSATGRFTCSSRTTTNWKVAGPSPTWRCRRTESGPNRRPSSIQGFTRRIRSSSRMAVRSSCCRRHRPPTNWSSTRRPTSRAAGSRAATLLEGVPVVDASVVPFQGRWWMFATVANLGAAHNLFLWHAPDLIGPWTPHHGNPVKTDARSARPGGTPFTMDGRLYRPSQDCSATYGGGITVCRVDSLTSDDFVETPIRWLGPRPGSSAARRVPHALKRRESDARRRQDPSPRQRRPAANDTGAHRARRPPSARGLSACASVRSEIGCMATS